MSCGDAMFMRTARKLRRLRKKVEVIVQKYEARQNHDEGAYDADCETCRILGELRTALAAGERK